MAANTDWQLDDNAPAAYERYLVPKLFAPWAEGLLDMAGVAAGSAVLDVGCGTGIVARRAAARVGAAGSTVGIDINDAMLEEARRAAAGAHPPVDWRRGDAAELPFDDGTFDVVLSQQALQFVPDPSAVLGEMHRVLRPGGRAALAVLRPIQYNAAYAHLAEALDRFAGADAGAMMRSPFSGWSTESLRQLAVDAGFDAVLVRHQVGGVRFPSVAEFVRQEAASSPLAGALGGVHGDALDQLVSTLAGSLAGCIDDDGVAFPVETYMLVARRH